MNEDKAHRRLKVLLLTDVFPPGSGGSGWSTFYLGKALLERGHWVRVVRPRYDERVLHLTKRVVEYRGLAVLELLMPQASRWAVRLGLGKALTERMASLAMERTAYAAVIGGEADVLHGQHALSAVAGSKAALAARAKGARVVSVATVRDYWPLCPTGTRLFTDVAGQTYECKECHRLGAYLKCASALGQAPARWLRTWSAARTLARCDAVVAVSEYVRSELARSGRVHEDKLVALPNLVDLPSVDRALASRWPLNDISPKDEFLLFVGKLDVNKGAHLLPEAISRSGIRLPLVVAGSGPLRDKLGEEAGKRGLDFRFYDWLENDSAILLMSRAGALLFPSAWQEPLSRVLLEACAAGAAIVALDTGGTGDIITHGQSGWLAQNQDEFVEGVRQVASDEGLNRRLRAGARQQAEQKFASPYVSERVEELYVDLLEVRNQKSEVRKEKRKLTSDF